MAHLCSLGWRLLGGGEVTSIWVFSRLTFPFLLSCWAGPHPISGPQPAWRRFILFSPMPGGSVRGGLRASASFLVCLARGRCSVRLVVVALERWVPWLTHGRRRGAPSPLQVRSYLKLHPVCCLTMNPPGSRAGSRIDSIPTLTTFTLSLTRKKNEPARFFGDVLRII